MTDGEQEATQEPEPITPDNNFPKASFPYLRLHRPDVCAHVCVYIRAYIRFDFCTYDPWQSLATSAARERVWNPEIYHFCCHFPRRLSAADRATGGIRINERGASYLYRNLLDMSRDLDISLFANH